MFVFSYYSLGGNSAMPGGLYAGPCYAFRVTYCIRTEISCFLVLLVLF